MSDFSLMPENRKMSGLPVSTPTAKVVGVFLLVAALVFGANQYFSGQKEQAAKEYQTAQTEQKSMEAKTQSLKKKLGEMQSAGGSSKLALITSLANARTDWVPLFFAFANAAEPGITYSQGFSGSAQSAAPGETGTASPLVNQQLSGTASSKQQFLRFVQRLKKVKIKGKPAFVSVVVNSVSANDTQAGGGDSASPGTGGAAEPGARTGSGAVSWSLTLGMIPPPAAPEQSTSGSSGSSGSAAPKGGAGG